MTRDSNVVDYPLTFHVVADERAAAVLTANDLAQQLHELVQPNGPKLVELYFRHVQPCYPVLHKPSMLEMYDRATERLDPALLAAIYLSALRWSSYDPELSVRQLPEAAKVRSIFRLAVDRSYHRPKLSSVQAMLLYLQCQPEDPLNPDHTYAWGLTCQVLAIGQCLGLHLDASSWSVPQAEKNVRKRLSWALFMQDRWTSLAYGRPVHIHHDDWTVPDLATEDFVDSPSDRLEGDSWSSKGHIQFMKVVQLTQILSDVQATFYTAKTSLDQNTTELYRKAQPLLARMSDWRQGLPTALSTDIVYQRRLSFHGKHCQSMSSKRRYADIDHRVFTFELLRSPHGNTSQTHSIYCSSASVLRRRLAHRYATICSWCGAGCDWSCELFARRPPAGFLVF